MPAPKKPAAGRPQSQRAKAEPKPSGVHAKLAAIQAAVGTVDKTGEIAFGRTKYDYMQEHGLLAILKPLWKQHNCTFVVGLAPARFGEAAVGAGALRIEGGVATVVVEALFTDVESGEQIRAYYTGQGQDSGDKATNKALTGANKYALQKFFQVPTEDIDDSDRTIPDGQKGKAGTKAKAKAEAKGNSAEPRLSKRQVDTLRSTAADAVREGLFTNQRVIAALQGSYGKERIEDLTPDEGKAFSEVLVEWIDLARDSE